MADVMDEPDLDEQLRRRLALIADGGRLASPRPPVTRTLSVTAAMLALGGTASDDVA
jgi:hypothetical protein